MILGHKPFPFPSWLNAFSSLILVSMKSNLKYLGFIEDISLCLYLYNVNKNKRKCREEWMEFLCLLSISNVSPQLIILFSLVLYLMRKIKCARSFVLQFFSSSSSSSSYVYGNNSNKKGLIFAGYSINFISFMFKE